MQHRFDLGFDEVLSPDPSIGSEVFAASLDELGVDYGPGWPDRFGQTLSQWSHEQVMSKPKTLSLFSGAGGLDIGFHQTGFDIRTVIEIDERFVETLRLNVYRNGLDPNCTVLARDIREYHPHSNEHYDFIIGGPPCQTFSAAGRRAGGVAGTDDERGMLFHEYVRLLETLQPVGFLFENVYGITGATDGRAWQDIQQAFQAAGYQIFARVLDAADYGVPQHRERLFIVGLKSSLYKFPRPTHGPDSAGKLPHFTAGEALADLSSVLGSAAFTLGGRYGHLLSEIPPGLNYSFYTAKLGHPNPLFAWRSKFSDFLYKADPATPVRTIKAQGGQYTGPFHWDSRPFSLEEFRRLQTFPDDYVIAGGRQAVIQQIGNSVPPQLARVLGLSVLEQVFGVRLPLKLQYVDQHEQFGFRQRKRSRTAEYAAKAASALLLTKPPTPASQLVDHRYWADLTDNFGWQQSPHANLPLEINSTFRQREWHIAVSGSSPESSRFQIEVEQAPGFRWELPVETVLLSAAPLSERMFTATWKALENELARLNWKGDLVQLNGYYQYTPALRAKLVAHGSIPEPRDFWRIAQLVVAGVGVRVSLHQSSLAELWNVAESELIEIAQFLRRLGYEIRNHNTNLRVPPQHYLIPYHFPTLNSMSVQLRKSLLSNGRS